MIYKTNSSSKLLIALMLIACDTQNETTNSECESDFTMNVVAPSLQIDENYYYHIEWLEGYTQTFSTLDVITNTQGYNKIYWACNSGITYAGEFVSCVNPVSYTRDGIAHTVMSVWEEMMGDKITIYAGFTDWCDLQYVDSIQGIIDNIN